MNHISNKNGKPSLGMIIMQTMAIFALALVGGCGGALTVVEKAEADKYIREHGRDALVYYLKDEVEKRRPPSLEEARKMSGIDETRALKYIKHFVAQGADVNAKTDIKTGRETTERITPLHIAVIVFGNAEISKFLVSKGADVNAKDGYDFTPLHFATIRESDIELVKFLVSKGADVNAKDSDVGFTPLYGAILKGNIELARFLVSKRADVNAKSADGGFTPLHVATQMGNVELVRFLVSKGADVNAKMDNGGLAPLHIAIKMGNVELVRFLVSKRADINARDNDGKTPADYAAMTGKNEIIKLLTR